MLLMSSMLQIWMKLMLLMLLMMMSNLTIMTMMMILMVIRPGEGGTFCWLASQPARLQNAITEFDRSPTLTRSRGPRGDNIKRTSITTDQHLEDLTRRGPVARRISLLIFYEKIFDSENPGSSKKITVNGVPLTIFRGLGGS